MSASCGECPRKGQHNGNPVSPDTTNLKDTSQNIIEILSNANKYEEIFPISIMKKIRKNREQYKVGIDLILTLMLVC